jgi:hypothetical protein
VFYLYRPREVLKCPVFSHCQSSLSFEKSHPLCFDLSLLNMNTFSIFSSFCLFFLCVHGQATPQCPPSCNPNANTCSWPTAEDCIYPSPSTPNPRAACACRAGYKATAPGVLDTDTTKQWRLPADEGSFRVWVAEGIECNTLCDVWYGVNSCQEVVELPAACLSNSAPTTSNLPVYSLGEPVTFPSAILQSILTLVGNPFNQTTQNGSSYFYDGNRLAAVYDNTTGQTSFWPKFESLVPSTTISNPIDRFSKYLGNRQIFPVDDTNFRALLGSTLFGAKNTAGNSSSPAAYLTDVRVERNVTLPDGEYTIHGPGTKAFFSYGSDGNIQSLTHRLRPAIKLSTTFESISSDHVTQNILDVLSANNLTNAALNSVDFCFYDSGEQFIQPAYRYQVTTEGPDGAANISYVGYISALSQPPEAMPDLKPPTPEVSPTTPTSNDTVPRLRNRQATPLTVGRYPISNNDVSSWCESDTDTFWQGLYAASLLDFGFGIFGSHSFEGASAITNAQYYWGDDIEYEGARNSYVNSVNLAFQCTHGNIHEFWPNGNEASVTLADIGNLGGFGSAAGGSLDYWLIKACDVIPTITQYINKNGASDAHEAWDVWWNVFNGVHVIAGFSTEANAGDNIETDVSFNIARGAGVAMTWLNTINQAHQYNPLSSYTDPNWGTQNYGRPAAIFPCGHGDDTIFMRDDIGAANCLTMIWY